MKLFLATILGVAAIGTAVPADWCEVHQANVADSVCVMTG